VGDPVPAGPVASGERILLIDAKQRRYLLTLASGAQFHTHAGIVAHDGIIGQEEGSTVTGSTGRQFLMVRPTLGDVVLKMPRGAQVIYPKDLGAILLAADIGPGQRILEAGVGSGALSMALVRAGASVVGYEIREDFAARARANVAAYLGAQADYRVEARDVTEGIDETGLDRVLLDMPEPWRVLAHAAGALRPGGILLAYLPSINQTAQLRRAIDVSPFALAVTSEVLHRTWHIEPRSVRPDHRMVAHTGFLTWCRRLAGGPSAPAWGGHDVAHQWPASTTTEEPDGSTGEAWAGPGLSGDGGGVDPASMQAREPYADGVDAENPA
jgi:tRNA (adenine57-N1/adenine58-N1)-methyltransferase